MVQRISYDDFMKNLSEQISRLRSENSLTQKELAERGEGLRQSTIAKFESGVSQQVTLKTTFELSQALSLPLSELISCAESKETAVDPMAGISREIKAANPQKQKLIIRLAREILRDDD